MLRGVFIHTEAIFKQEPLAACYSFTHGADNTRSFIPDLLAFDSTPVYMDGLHRQAPFMHQLNGTLQNSPLLVQECNRNQLDVTCTLTNNFDGLQGIDTDVILLTVFSYTGFSSQIKIVVITFIALHGQEAPRGLTAATPDRI